MRAGELRHRVSIENLVVDLDSDGAQVEGWLPFTPGLVPAAIEPLSGREQIAAAATQSKVSTRIRMRYFPGVLPSMRVVHRQTVYNIEAVIADQISGVRSMTLLCTTGLNEG